MNNTKKATRILQPTKGGVPARLLAAMVIAGQAALTQCERDEHLTVYGGELPATGPSIWIMMNTLLMMVATVIFLRGFWNCTRDVYGWACYLYRKQFEDKDVQTDAQTEYLTSGPPPLHVWISGSASSEVYHFESDCKSRPLNAGKRACLLCIGIRDRMLRR